MCITEERKKSQLEYIVKSWSIMSIWEQFMPLNKFWEEKNIK